ncbi:hypothetical protein THRCLA_08281 [Thraustotheca clavata]|uniref:Sec1 family domain-containing protein 2 n=1 Tax=Thraustotheca clavata TaxID=74557 RepID=A0A1V9Z7M6_9STRA|nr:hypothetical protein THRCLA_08281 [Thraustotheca clavata]
MTFRCSDESLGPLLELSSHVNLRGSLLVADSSAIEALAWAGGMPYLLQTLQMMGIVDWNELCRSLFDATAPRTPAQLLNPWQLKKLPNVLVLTCTPLNQTQKALLALLDNGLVGQLIVGSTMPEKAHGEKFSFRTFEETIKLSAKNVMVKVSYVPLLYAPLSNKDGADPSLFVLTHPQCAAAFPIMRCDVKHPSEPWKHVNEIPPADIPEDNRKTFKLLAQVLGGILMQWQLQVNEHIYAMGGTSLKVGHTLLHHLNELQGEYNMHDVKQWRSASLILIDRTLDLATPMSHQFSLLDRILQQLPRATAAPSTPAHHISQVAPLNTASDDPRYQNNIGASSQWNGGLNICHGQNTQTSGAFRNLISHSPVMALRELSTSLRAVAMDLIKRKATPTPEKGGSQQLRGRDVVQRWLKCIDNAYDPKETWRNKELLQLGLTVLETMCRMEKEQQVWSHLSSIEKRYSQSRFQGAAEWVLPEVADLLSLVPEEPAIGLDAALQLVIFAFSIAGGFPIEDYTRSMVSAALCRAIIADNGSSELLPPELKIMLSQVKINHLVTRVESELDDDEWGWDEVSPPPPKALASPVVNPAIELAVSEHVASMLPVLEECGQLFQEVAPEISNEYAMGLIPQIVSQLINPNRPSMPQLQHITDASEQLTRAGIDLLKSGLSVFGLSGQALKAAQSSTPHIANDQEVCIVFVIGGIALHEVQAVAEVLKSRPDLQIIIGSTTLATPHELQRHIWSSTGI